MSKPFKRKSVMWGIVARWHDEVFNLSQSKRRAIAEFRKDIGMSWPALKRSGWYVAKVTCTWDEPEERA